MVGEGECRAGGVKRVKRPSASSRWDGEAREEGLEEGLEGLEEGLEGLEKGLEGSMEERLDVGDPGGYGEWWGVMEWLGEGLEEGLEGLEEDLEGLEESTEEGLSNIIDRFEAVLEGGLELEKWWEMLEGLGGVARVGNRWGL